MHSGLNSMFSHGMTSRYEEYLKDLLTLLAGRNYYSWKGTQTLLKHSMI